MEKKNVLFVKDVIKDKEMKVKLIMNNNEMLKEYLEYRTSIYFWLKSLYISEPNETTLEGIMDICRDNLEGEYPEGEENFIKYFGNFDRSKLKKLVLDIRVEYARLFLGPKHILAPPYESVYTSYSKSIFGESCMQVRKLYEEAGIKINVKGNIPDDFIGFELEFMYYLSFNSIKAFEEENIELLVKILNYQNYFIKEHLVNWMDSFCSDIINNTNMDYFKIVAQFTKEFIKNDYDFISKIS